MNKMSLMCSVLISVSVVHYWWKTNSEQQTDIEALRNGSVLATVEAYFENRSCSHVNFCLFFISAQMSLFSLPRKRIPELDQ